MVKLGGRHCNLRARAQGAVCPYKLFRLASHSANRQSALRLECNDNGTAGHGRELDYGGCSSAICTVLVEQDLRT